MSKEKNKGQTPLTNGVAIDPSKGYRYKDEKLKYIDIQQGDQKVKVAAKADVDYTDMSPKINSFLADVSKDLGVQGDLGFDLVVTSARDGEHSKGSKHYTGEAIDLRIGYNYRGDEEGVNTPYDDPIYKYFQDGKGKEFVEKHGIYLYNNLEHGSAPHIHLQTERMDNNNADKQAQQTTQSNKPIVLKSQSDLIFGELSQPEFNFLYDIKNQEKAVEDKTANTKADKSKMKLIDSQRQRKMLQDSWKQYEESFQTSPDQYKYDESQVREALQPNQVPLTQFSGMEELSENTQPI